MKSYQSHGVDYYIVTWVIEGCVDYKMQCLIFFNELIMYVFPVSTTGAWSAMLVIWWYHVIHKGDVEYNTKLNVA